MDIHETKHLSTLNKKRLVVLLMLAFCLNSTQQLPGNSQVSLTHYKRGCLPPPLSLVLLISCFSLALVLPFLSIPFPSHFSLCVSLSVCLSVSLSLSLSLPFSASTALNKLYSILHHPVAGPSCGPAKVPSCPIPHHTSIEHIPSSLHLFIITEFQALR